VKIQIFSKLAAYGHVYLLVTMEVGDQSLTT